MITCLLGTAVIARAEGPFTVDTRIETLSFEMSSPEPAPFLELPRQFEYATEPLPLPATTARPLSLAASETVEEMPVASTPLLKTAAEGKNAAQTTRDRLRESLAHEGIDAANQRDSLTAEALNVARWTFVTLLIGIGAVFALKQFGGKTLPLQNRGGMKVVECLPLGRHQQLQLVDVGGERFVVACDSQGIKAMTLLPSWPTAEGETAATIPWTESPEAAKAA